MKLQFLHPFFQLPFNRLKKRFTPFWLLLILHTFMFTGYSDLSFADDPGITKVRLIQQTDTSYLLEADVPQVILNTIKRPVFPDRFEMTDFDFTNQSGWITLKMTISTSGPGFSPEDEILLPWLRNGIDFTAQWLDGSTYKGLFNRSLNGIHIPLSEVMPTKKSTIEVLSDNFLTGIRHMQFHFIHALLIFLLVFSFKGYSVFKYLLWFSFGQAFALILSELGLPGVDLLFSELLILLLVLLIAYTLASKREFKYPGIALFITGLFHGTAFIHEILDNGLEPLQRIQALFAFNLAIELAQYLLALALVLTFPLWKGILKQNKKVGIAAGSISIFMMLLIYQENISTGQVHILDFESSKSSINVNVPASAGLSNRQVQRGAGIMTTPFMLFLSIEPYEVRQEILMEAEEIVRFYYPEHSSIDIPVVLQEELKKKISQQVRENTDLRINNLMVEPGDINTDFVHLSRGGVSIREKPIVENIFEGILGLTIIYDIETLPDSVDFSWSFFTDSVSMVEASVVDAHGAFTKILNSDDPEIKWKNRLAGYRVPVIEAVLVQKYAFPLVSFILFLGIIVFAGILIIWGKKDLPVRLIVVVMLTGFVVYPFVRTSTSLPFVSQLKPSKEAAGTLLGDLLTNVYRAFDRRQEDAVYDRLSLSVTGDQLTDIYLQNRQVMALENRGGARAKVDEVDILEVFEVDRSEDQGIKADAMWTVRGSVNHFGHTHYRQNQYRALVSFVNEGGIWKISSIEPIEEIRIY
jgi:hypothetical protein